MASEQNGLLQLGNLAEIPSRFKESQWRLVGSIYASSDGSGPVLRSGICPGDVPYHEISASTIACPSNHRAAIPALAGNFCHSSRRGDDGVPDTDGTPSSRAISESSQSRPLLGQAPGTARSVIGAIKRLVFDENLV